MSVDLSGGFLQRETQRGMPRIAGLERQVVINQHRRKQPHQILY